MMALGTCTFAANKAEQWHPSLVWGAPSPEACAINQSSWRPPKAYTAHVRGLSKARL